MDDGNHLPLPFHALIDPLGCVVASTNRCSVTKEAVVPTATSYALRSSPTLSVLHADVIWRDFFSSLHELFSKTFFMFYTSNKMSYETLVTFLLIFVLVFHELFIFKKEQKRILSKRTDV